MVLPKVYGLQQGWPVAPGQYAPPYSPPGSVPSGAVLSSLSNGYVRNDSGGYVLRSFT